MIITIDGPAGSGKSTVADILAEKLGFIHFNSGALFRGATAYLVEQNFNIDSITIKSPLPKLNISAEIINDTQHVFVNGKDYTSVLRNNTISKLVPLVALNVNCRNAVDSCQKEFCLNHNIVIEGRDVGSFVFPNAEFKFYLDCSIKERARRRYNEEKVKNPDITLAQIEKEIEKRDFLDKTREIAPLIIPDGAIIVDSSTLSADQVANKMLAYIKL